MEANVETGLGGFLAEYAGRTFCKLGIGRQQGSGLTTVAIMTMHQQLKKGLLTNV